MRCDGLKVTVVREALRLSRAETACLAGVSISVIERMECGAPVYDESVAAVAVVLGMQVPAVGHPDETPGI